jgi:hypothetical protein
MTKADVKPNFANLEPVINILRLLATVNLFYEVFWYGTWNPEEPGKSCISEFC